MSSAYSQAADLLKLIIDGTFLAEGAAAVHDDLHESLGFDGEWHVGINPDDRGDIVNARTALVQETWIQVKVFAPWTKMVEPTQAVDPRDITEAAERFRRAIKASGQPATDPMWYFNLVQISYPRDPTGNRTRFVATIRVFGNNASLVETTD